LAGAFKDYGRRLLRNARRTLIFDVVRPARYFYDSARTAGATRLLLVSDLEMSTSEEQFSPFHRHRDELRTRLNVLLNHVRLDRVMASPQSALAEADVIGLKLAFDKKAYQAEYFVRTIEAAKPKGAKLIYFDGDDDSAILWPSMLPFVDLYVKKHLFRDPEMYSRRFIGKSNLTDYVARKFGVTYDNDIIQGETTPVDPRYLDRLYLGYNLALDDKIVGIYQKTRDAWRNRDRPNDVASRLSLRGWESHLRKDVAPILATLPPQYKTISPTEKVSQEEYDRELSSSKICVSPFGFGELCWRDFEAVLWGSLMIKPDMSHIRTRPDIFVPYETYVPVKWDFSDLASQCIRFLEDTTARERIVEQAYTVLSDFYEKGVFFDVVAEILSRVGVPASQPLAAPQSSPRPL
jgi:hypothetical protein